VLSSFYTAVFVEFFSFARLELRSRLSLN